MRGVGWVLGLGGALQVAGAQTPVVLPPEPLAPPTKISIVNVNNLSFSPAFQGDPPELVDPNPNMGGDAALFLLQGRPYAAVIVLIPDDVVVLKTSSREVGRKTLNVRRLRARPEAGHPFQLSSRGSATVSVGGTRETLARNQAPGDYEGHFFVTVMYQ